MHPHAVDVPAPSGGGSSSAVDVLRQAQLLADRLRQEAEAEAAELRAQSAETARQRDEALAELAFTRNRLADARADVSRILADAAEQAGAITEMAGRNADEAVLAAQL